MSAVIRVLVFSLRYGISIIFRYDFDWGRWETSTLSAIMWLAFLTYFSIVWRFKENTTLTSNLILCNDLLMLVIWLLLSSMNLVLLLLLIGTIIYLLFGQTLHSHIESLFELTVIVNYSLNIFDLLALRFEKASSILRAFLVVAVVGLDA